jgi:hypothetical protein
VSKLDDEEHDCVDGDGVKIQVTDDHFLNNGRLHSVAEDCNGNVSNGMLDPAVLEAMKQLQFTTSVSQANNAENFNYAGSFSSIGESSTHSYQSNLSQRRAAVTANSGQDNEQGLYSVKNGAIQYNVASSGSSGETGHGQMIQSLSPVDYSITNVSPFEYRHTPQHQHHHYQPDLYFKANLVDLPAAAAAAAAQNSNNYESSYLEMSNGYVAPRQSLNNAPKMNSLKQLKKELALKRAYAANTVMYSQQPESGSPLHLDGNNNSTTRFNEAAFQYLNGGGGGSTSNNFNAARSKEVLLSPDNVIASVV